MAFWENAPGIHLICLQFDMPFAI